MLYTERIGVRTPIDKTYCISNAMYCLLFNSCNKYKKNLTTLFQINCLDDFTKQNYNKFDEQSFIAKMQIIIPNLYQDKHNKFYISSYGDENEQYAILDYIEFFAQNIRDICESWNNERYQNYKNINCLKTNNVFNSFRKEINNIFIESGLLYTLTEEYIIERIVDNNLITPEIRASISHFSEEGIRELLEDAMSLFKTPRNSARQDSVEKIWAAFERLKTYYTDLDKKKSLSKIIEDMSNGDSDFFRIINDEFKALTQIGNSFRIRHHETYIIDIKDIRQYDYFFNRCFSLISFALQYLH